MTGWTGKSRKLFLEIEEQVKEPLARLNKQSAHLSALVSEAENIQKMAAGPG